MEKHYLPAKEMVNIANQHAYCAKHLLEADAGLKLTQDFNIEALLPVCTLYHCAFNLLLKACLIQQQRKISGYKNLSQLIKANRELELSRQDVELIQTLSRQQAFRKGVEYLLWDNREQALGFLSQIKRLYQRILKQIPLELTDAYYSP